MQKFSKTYERTELLYFKILLIIIPQVFFLIFAKIVTCILFVNVHADETIGERASDHFYTVEFFKTHYNSFFLRFLATRRLDFFNDRFHVEINNNSRT